MPKEQEQRIPLLPLINIITRPDYMCARNERNLTQRSWGLAKATPQSTSEHYCTIAAGIRKILILHSSCLSKVFLVCNGELLSLVRLQMIAERGDQPTGGPMWLTQV